MSQPTIRASIIATTYNQSRDLDLYLTTLRAQTCDEFEIVIADDGSKEDTAAVIRKHQTEFFGDRLVHVWHEDVGYRKCRILNQAIPKAKGEWLIFTDSDLIVHPQFVEDHLSVREENSLFMGRRVDLSPTISEWLREDLSRLFSPGFYLRLVSEGVQGKTKNVNRGFRVGIPALARMLGMDRVPDLLGSNFSISRELLVRLNGFDESMEHYWGEDGDLFVRARNSGAKIHGRKSYAVEFHLWHKMRQPQPDAERWYQNLLQKRDYVRCSHGLVKG